MKEESEAEQATSLKNTFSQNLLLFRKKFNYSQKDLAEKLNTSNKNISKWERAETIPDILTIKKIAKIFDVTVDILINPIADYNKKALAAKITVPFKYRLSYLILADAIIFLLTCVLFFIFKYVNISIFPPAYLFMYMLPMIDISIFIFICIIKKKVDPISLSLMGWLITICFYITFIHHDRIIYIFLIAIAYQVLAPIFAYLINSHKIITLNKKFLGMLRKKTAAENDKNSENPKSNSANQNSSKQENISLKETENSENQN